MAMALGHARAGRIGQMRSLVRPVDKAAWRYFESQLKYKTRKALAGWTMPAKRSLWSKETINKNYLINIIHRQEVCAILPARASETAAEKRDSANLSSKKSIDISHKLLYM